MTRNVYPKLDVMLDFLYTVAVNVSKRNDENQAKRGKSNGKKQALFSNAQMSNMLRYAASRLKV